MIIKEKTIAAKTISLETGRIAKQADGAVLARVGDTMVLATVVANKTMNEGQDFVPLSVEFREKFYASGKIPGGFLRREGRLSDREILISRIIDRQIRPLLPKNWFYETQVIVNVLSYDGENQPDMLGAVAASAALCISDIPFEGPIASVRAGRVNGEVIINPTAPQIEQSDLEIVVAGSADSIVMVEGEAKEISEEDLLNAVKTGHKLIVEFIELQKELIESVQPQKREAPAEEIDEAFVETVRAKIGKRMQDILSKTLKLERAEAEDSLVEEIAASLEESYPECLEQVKNIVHEVHKEVIREKILSKGVRVDGRKTQEIRKITPEVQVLPRAHGSALFTRGETQALVTTTLGSGRDAQMLDNIDGDSEKVYMLQYNFPPFCTGEARMIRGVSRREVGHGNLAERSLKSVLPSPEEFPYTIRVVSDVMESNGSSSMASVCGACLSLMDAGVPIRKMVSGIAMGLITQGKKFAVLSDILGEEDHYGDMDFKVTGTDDGVTAIQMDLKILGLSFDLMKVALEQAREGRLFILERMREALSEPRPELSKWAPRITTMRIDVDKIGAVIGPSGKVIKDIIAKTGVEIDIDQDGTVHIFTMDAAKAEEACDMIRALIAEPEVGKIYDATITRLMEFGAFAEFMPGKEGLIHIGEMQWGRTNSVKDVVKEGDKVKVKLFEIDSQGRNNLSMKRLSEPPEGYVEPERRPRDNNRKPNFSRGRRDNNRRN
ncbi:MAG: polyribonucleotide nucleotidyltransferase [Candidatus Marinimicrobia bacterium]|nr:polyribonucleotide nucleotidyltransferase [Candidatus Neomarinimicrobiota bacterium]MDD4962023.1 polyribonucleotide nucleotidyltransferase [Candidatus Neomarinimicrobiota bacterium]MDD5709047.1 polyribonucleotide nucleotidyltransferase [Candidatus Neomarinimicrobiota bacterium]